MPTALIARRSSGAATTMAPTPPAHSSSSADQPTGTAQTKRIACGNPRLAASAVDSVVFGPGVKLMAVASARRAVNSAKGMVLGSGLWGSGGGTVRAISATVPVQLIRQTHKLCWCRHRHTTGTPRHAHPHRPQHPDRTTGRTLCRTHSLAPAARRGSASLGARLRTPAGGEPLYRGGRLRPVARPGAGGVASAARLLCAGFDTKRG